MLERIRCMMAIFRFGIEDVQRARGAFHEPQSAAGILPADQPEKSTAGKMPAAPWRCGLTCSRFMVPMHAKKRKEAFHEPTQPRPLPGGERAFVRAMSVPLLGGVSTTATLFRL